SGPGRRGRPGGTPVEGRAGSGEERCRPVAAFRAGADLHLPTDPDGGAALYPRPMSSPIERVLTWFGVDDTWERPRPALGRQDVVLAASVEAVSLLALELVRSSGGFENTDVPVWAQWLAVSTGA